MTGVQTCALPICFPVTIGGGAGASVGGGIGAAVGGGLGLMSGLMAGDPAVKLPPFKVNASLPAGNFDSTKPRNVLNCTPHL